MQTIFWRFLDSNVDHGATLRVDFNPFLVVLSFGVAMLAGYTALKVVERMGVAPTPRVRYAWLALGAAAMGSGIWAMHFVGMLAFSLPVAVTYSLPVTLVSVLPGVFASAMALHVMDRIEITAPRRCSAV